MGDVLEFRSRPGNFAVRDIGGGREALIRLTRTVPEGCLASVRRLGVLLFARVHYLKNDYVQLTDERGRKRPYHRSALEFEGEVVEVRDKPRELPQMIGEGRVNLWRANPVGQIFDIRGRWAEDLDLTPEIVHSYGWVERIHPDHRESVVSSYVRSLITGEPYYCSTLIFAHGVYKPIVTTASPVHSGGRIILWDGLTQLDLAFQQQATK